MGLEEDKGPDHDVLPASRIGGRGPRGNGPRRRAIIAGSIGKKDVFRKMHRVLAPRSSDLSAGPSSGSRSRTPVKKTWQASTSTG
jgi:hypothetical protein